MSTTDPTHQPATHVLVVTGTPCGECDPAIGCGDCDLAYTIECPGVTDACRTWWECDRNRRQGRGVCLLHHDGGYRDDGDEREAHGETHRWLDGAWHVWSNECLGSTMDDATEDAWDISRAPGRYPVELDVDYDCVRLAAVSS